MWGLGGVGEGRKGEGAQLGPEKCQLPGPHIVGQFHEDRSPLGSMCRSAVPGGEACVGCCCACLWGGGMCVTL